MKFIGLPLVGGGEVYLNVDHIIALCPIEDGNTAVVASDRHEVEVALPVESVIDAMLRAHEDNR